MTRFLQLLLGGLFVLALVAFTAPSNAPAPIPAQAEEEAVPEGPIEILIVQGYIKNIDQENLTLTAPGAPADLPLKLAPDTRFIEEEQDISREEFHEGSLVRAALVPMGEEFLAVVVELVPEDEQPALPEDAQPEEEPAPVGDEPPPARL